MLGPRAGARGQDMAIPVPPHPAIDGLERAEGVRIRDTDTTRFWFNHNASSVQTPLDQIEAAGVLQEPL